jgi:hypothetical protein
MKAIDAGQSKPTYWQQVFSQSKANGANYNGEDLYSQAWAWPKDTYLQRRLRQRRFLEFMGSSQVLEKY